MPLVRCVQQPAAASYAVELAPPPPAPPPTPQHTTHPEGQADDGVAQQLKMPPLHQGRTRCRPVCQKEREPVKLH
jgi:hypothetical protein